MREITAQAVTDVVSRLCISANRNLPEDLKCRIRHCAASENWPIAKEILEQIEENFAIAAETHVPICQDTGMACVFLKVGQEVHIIGNLGEAVNEGVRRGYREGYLRKSVVADPLNRVNTGDNTPAVIHYEIVPGDRLEITVAPKGFCSENMSAIKMLKPSDGVEGVLDFVVQTVRDAGPNPCPPIVVGVGIGGTFEKAAQLAKKALLRDVDSSNESPSASIVEVILEVSVESILALTPLPNPSDKTITVESSLGSTTSTWSPQSCSP